MAITKQDARGYCRNCTDSQLACVYHDERERVEMMLYIEESSRMLEAAKIELSARSQLEYVEQEYQDQQDSKESQ